MDEEQKKKRIRIMLIGLGILFGSIFLYKGMQKIIIAKTMSTKAHVVSVATMKVNYALWEPKLSATASLRATKGVTVTTELPGMIKKIYFTPGSTVEEGTVLVQLNADSETAALHALEANAELAQLTYDRDKEQFQIGAVSKQALNNDEANLKSLRAQVEQQAATVAKKTVKAPFSGRLGISMVNPGQFLNNGDKVVTLQTLDPIWADFYVPQQQLRKLHVGQKVILSSDIKHKPFTGTITTIDPLIDPQTRNVAVEATIKNPQFLLSPGMFAPTEIITGKPKRFLTVPLTAVSFNSFGDIVYVIRQQPAKKKKHPANLIAKQIFVKTGEKRGDQIQILSGLQAGDLIVVSGQLKLKNNSQVAINNSVLPSDNPNPQVTNGEL